MKSRKIISLCILTFIIISNVSTCFAGSAIGRDNTKFYGGYNTDYGPQVWSISTTLQVDYTKSGSNNNLNKVSISAIGERHVPGIGEGSYSFPKGMLVYNGSTLLGTEKQSNFTRGEHIIGSNQYLYMGGYKYINYSIPTNKTGKVTAELMFSVVGWTPIMGTSWWSSVTATI